MALCSTCGGKMSCPDCGPTRTVGGTDVECPPKKGAIWVHLKDDARKGIKGISVDQAGTAVETDDTGLAAFDKLDPGDYEVTIDVSGENVTKVYEAPTGETKKTVTIPETCDVQYYKLELKRLATLKVEVVEQGEGTKRFEGATVKVETDTEALPEGTTSEGAATFESVKAGKYKVTVTLSEEDAKTFVAPAPSAPIEVELKHGEEHTLKVEIEPKNFVSPVLELEHKVVLKDRDLNKHLTDSETKSPTGPTRVRIKLAQTNDKRPYGKPVKLVCNPANVEVYFDDECKQKLDGDLAAGVALAEDKAKLISEGKALDLYLRGKTAGAFEAKVVLEDPADDPYVELKTDELDKSPAKEAMGVVELIMELYFHKKDEIDKVEVDPDIPPAPLGGSDTYDPFATAPQVPKPELYHPNQLKAYHEALVAANLPDQEKLTDEQKVKEGRLLHKQRRGKAPDYHESHGRAKIVVKKTEGDHWPAGTENYGVYLNRTADSGALEVYEQEWGGDAKKFPHELKLADLKSKDLILWVEGKTATKHLRDVRLDLTVDRPESEVAHDPLRNGDWCRFSVVEIKEVKVDYTNPANRNPAEDKDIAWSPNNDRFTINLEGTDDLSQEEAVGRKITIGAQLSEKIKDVVVHFMLVPDKDNGKVANWGIDIPKGQQRGPKKDAAFGITGGDDSGCFAFAGPPNERDLYFKTGGLVDHSVQEDYEVMVSRQYDDGSWQTKTVELTPPDGFDATNWEYYMTFTDADFPSFKENPWKWDTVSPRLKQRDKEEAKRKKLFHLSAKTDDKGYAKVVLCLSRFGGDKFWPSAYIDQDPHLSKYVHDHAELGKRTPVQRSKPIQVWKRMWYQRVVVQGMAVRDLTGARDQYVLVKTEFKDAGNLTIPRATVDGYNPQAIYPEWMIRGNNSVSMTDALVVSDTNKNQFFNTFVVEASKPNKIPVLVCDAQWDPKGNSKAKNVGWKRRASWPVDLNVGMQTCDPPLQGGDLLVSGTWSARDKQNDGSYTNHQNNVALDPGDIELVRGRDNTKTVRIKFPAGVQNPTAKTRVKITGLVVQVAKSYLGESFNRRILAVYDPAEPDDFQNTIVHEFGHAYKQVVQGNPAGGATGIPEHGCQFDAANQGNHCRHEVDKCVMYDSGPIAGSHNRYCDVCHPFLLVQDMTQIV